MLNRQCGDPKIICWNRCAVSLELSVSLCIDVRCLGIRIKNLNALIRQELNKNCLVALRNCSASKARTKFSNHNKRNKESICRRKDFDGRFLTFGKIRITIRINEYLHFQRSASTVRISSKALSASESATHVLASDKSASFFGRFRKKPNPAANVSRSN